MEGVEMKTLWLALAVVMLVFGHSAMAADFPFGAPFYRPLPRFAVPTYWTGCYIGGNVGGVWESDTTSITAVDPTGIAAVALAAGAIPTSFNYGRTNAIGGAQLGCNYQVSNWVFGIETDIDGTRLDGGQTISTSALNFVPLASSVSQNLNWLGTTRGRIGVAWDNFLFYASAGAAYGQVSYTYTLSNVPGGGAVALAAADSATQVGWTVGGGVEVGLGSWTLKTEYLYYDLGNHTLSAPCTFVGSAPCTVPNTVFSANYQNTGSIARIGLNYRFGPVLAGY
jgi:outer membrane immunogenic protein